MTQSMRDRLALIVANHTNHTGAVWTDEEWAEAVAEYNGGTDMQRRMMLGVSQPLLAVDAILTELERPSESVVASASSDRMNLDAKSYTAMIRAIREGS